MKQTLFLLFTLFFSFQAFSQKEWDNWFYGGDNLLTFKNGSPQIVHGFVQPKPTQFDFYNYYYAGIFPETISYSDPNTGNMRFLVGQYQVFGTDYKAFPAIRTQFLRACVEDVNAYHIIPFHNNPDKFYIIQFQDCLGDLLAQQEHLQVKCPNAVGLAYSVVDMTMNNGLGDLSTINQPITQNLSAQMTTVKHANGKDVWVIVHPYNSGTFSARLVTDNGIGAAVNTDIGPMVSGSYLNHVGTLTASRSGRTLAGYSAAAGSVQLFDFDNATGELSNYRTLPYKDYVISMQFSPDDSKLYYCGFSALYQYDISAPDIGNSLTKIFDNGGNMHSMQLATDGKIYVSRLSFPDGNSLKDYSGVIQCPNLPQYACNFNPRALPSGYMSYMTLINDIVKDPKAPPVTKFSLGNDTVICSGSYTLKAPAGWQDYQWNTGETTQSITVTQPGLYHVITGNTGFNCPSGYGFINILDKGKPLDLGPDTSICSGMPYKIHIDDNFSSIQWENGSHARDSLITAANLYKVTATGKDGCLTTDSIRVKINNTAQANFGNDTALCNGSTLVLQLSPAGNFSPAPVYNWQDGSTQSNYIVKKPGKYWGSVRVGGCLASDTILISYLTVLSASVGNDTSFCKGDSVVLKTPVQNASYLWNTGESTQQIAVKTPGIYSVKVNNGSCDFYDTVKISMALPVSFSLGNDTAVCSSENFVLKPALPNGNYLWQDGSGNHQFQVQASGQYWLQFSRDGCSTRDTIQVDIKKPPAIRLGADTTLCENKSLLLEPISPDIARYQWQDGSTASSYLVSKAGNYRLKVFGTNGCTNKDSITISYTALPVVEISGDSVLCGGNPIVLTGKVRNANNFVWQTGSTNAQFTVTDPGMYKITATNMCGTSVAAKIINKGICSLILPNAFTPNGDWTNDIFRIKYPFETRQFLFTIYNRWGEKIFQTKDIKTGWDGTYHGQLQPAGSYIWFISLSDRENHYQQLHGTVLLIR